MKLPFLLVLLWSTEVPSTAETEKRSAEKIRQANAQTVVSKISDRHAAVKANSPAIAASSSGGIFEIEAPRLTAKTQRVTFELTAPKLTAKTQRSSFEIQMPTLSAIAIEPAPVEEQGHSVVGRGGKTRQCLPLYSCFVKHDVRNAINEVEGFYTPSQGEFCDVVKTFLGTSAQCATLEQRKDINHNFGFSNYPGLMECEPIRMHQENLVQRFNLGEETFKQEQNIEKAMFENMSLLLTGNFDGFCRAMKISLNL